MMQSRNQASARTVPMPEIMSSGRRVLLAAVAAVTALSLLTADLSAQGQNKDKYKDKDKSKGSKSQQQADRGRGDNDDYGNGVKRGKIPPGHLPSPGECRVWFDGRPPGQQPSPTSCARAQADAARNGGRVVYGGDRQNGRYDDDRDIVRYPNDARYPETMPEMVWGVLTGRGQPVNDALRWVNRSDATARIVDANRDGRPESVTWYDNANRVVQQWQDANGDGRADRVQLYENNAPVRIIRGKKK